MTHFWGPLFPDAARPSFTKAAVAAVLSLAPTVTNSGSFDLVTLQALVGGAAGNLVTVQFQAATLPHGVAVQLSETSTTCLLRFVDSSTTLAQIATALASSTLIKMIGTWDPLATAAAGDDEFGPTALTGGADARTSTVTFWGPLFPDSSPTAPAVAGIGPAGSATFALALEDGFAVTYSWGCSVIKTYSGLEFRAANFDDPKQTYSGPALLLGSDTEAARIALQKYAALGRAFLLGLPYEALTLTAGASGVTVSVHSTSACDWALPGQRVVVVAIAGELVEWTNAVIQSVTSTTFVLDVSSGAAGIAGALIMPVVAVYLDPQQGFDRYKPAVAVEQWTIKATAAFFGYFGAPKSAYLSLAPTVTNSGAATGVMLTAIAQGAAGNLVTVQFLHGSLSSTGEIDESGTACLIKFSAGVTTMTNLAALIASSSLVTMSGTYTGSATLAAGDDEFGPRALAHGADQAPGTMGLGATVKTYFRRPLWDRGIDSDGTINDTMHSLVEVVDDVGALPFSVGPATAPDYGRALAISAELGGEWQWLKAFLFALRGAQVAFWLPTFRADMSPIGVGPGGSGSTGTITVSSATGDLFTWWPLVRQHVLIIQGVKEYYVEVTDAEDNHDGTLTLTIQVDPDDPDAILPDDIPMDCISWLELCRMETDDAPVTFKDATFQMQTSARVVSQ